MELQFKYYCLQFTICFSCFVVLICILYKFSKNFRKKFRLAWLKKKYFFGDYADNLLEMKKFFADNDGKIMIQWIHDDKLKATIIKPATSDAIEIQESIREQARIQSRNLRKRHKCTLFYVEDHFITRLIGYKKGMEHFGLSQ